MTGNRIGVFGGTFNPVHIGHMILAQTASEAYDLTRVIFVPASMPPHKHTHGIVSAEHRMAMLEAAVAMDARFEVSDIELKRPGPSYTVDTLRQLKRLFPETELCFIVGADTLFELHSWKDALTVLDLCRFVAFARPGFDIDRITPENLKLPEAQSEEILRHTSMSRMVDISSSDIRHRLAEGMSIRYLVPEPVEIYINEHRLYT